jgi:hypothetical protein
MLLCLQATMDVKIGGNIARRKLQPPAAFTDYAYHFTATETAMQIEFSNTSPDVRVV